MLGLISIALSERTRRMVALAGIALWLMYPFVYFGSTRARWTSRCEGRTFNGSFDECFNDALPIFELIVFPVTFALAFARLAFSMFAQSADKRTVRWRLAGSGAAADYYPTFQLVCVVGIIWAILHVAYLPLSFDYWYLLTYWAAWLAWFLIGALAALPTTPTGQT